MTLTALLAAMLMATPQVVKAATYKYSVEGLVDRVFDFGGSPFSVGNTFSFDFIFNSDRPFNNATNGIETYFLDLVEANIVIDRQQVYSTNGGPGVTMTATVAENHAFSGQDIISVTLNDVNHPTFGFANFDRIGDDSILTSLDLISAFQADFNGPTTFRFEDFGLASFVEGTAIGETFTRLDNVAPIPLPPALALLLSGLGILSVVRNRSQTTAG